MEYTVGQIRQYIREVIRASKNTARVDSGLLKDTMRGAYIGRTKSIEFRQLFYGAYGTNSKLIANAERIIPNDLPWKVIFEDEDGRETTVKGKTRTGREIRRSAISQANIGTDKIKQLLKSLTIANGSSKNDTAEGSGSTNEE
jgi:hypothetical protein